MFSSHFPPYSLPGDDNVVGADDSDSEPELEGEAADNADSDSSTQWDDIKDIGSSGEEGQGQEENNMFDEEAWENSDNNEDEEDVVPQDKKKKKPKAKKKKAPSRNEFDEDEELEEMDFNPAGNVIGCLLYTSPSPRDS